MMTWDELKKLVDTKLEENGKDGNTELWFIDISFPDSENIVINIDKDCGMGIS